VLLALSAVAVLSTIATLRRLWRTRWPHRWRYLPLAALILGSLLVFLVFDLV
jgi:hypothetical protein